MQYIHRLLVIAILFPIACFAGVHDSGKKTTDKNGVNISNKFMHDLKSFDTHFSKVKKGWSIKQLTDYAGSPTGKTNNVWSYTINEPDTMNSEVLDGNFVTYSFKIKSNLVSEVRKDVGHASVQ